MPLPACRSLFALLPLLPLLAAGSCDRRTEADAPVFRFINRGDIITLDLNQMSYAQDFRVTYAIREGLYSPVGPDYTPMPAGAVGCDVSADKLTYTFHLRSEAKWSNGDRVVAGDYVFSWKLLLTSPGEYTYLLYPIAGAEAFQKAYAADGKANFSAVGIRAVDDLTFEVRLAHPMTYFLDVVAFPPFYPRHEPSMRPFARPDGGYDAAYTRPPALVTNGPFVITDWRFKRDIHMDRNVHYWDAKNVRAAAIEMVNNDNTLSQFLQFEAGAVNYIAEVPNEIGPDLLAKKYPGFGTCTAFGTFFLTLNCRDTLPNGHKNPMADVRVRQALSMAIDKQYVVDRISRLGEKVATQYIPPGTLPGYTGLPGLPFDVARAKALLAEAGFPGGKDFPTLTLLFNSENQLRARVSQSLKQQWRQTLGIDVEIQPVEGKIFKEHVSKKDYDIATVAWYGDYPDVSTFTDKYLSNSLQNDCDWQNKEYDALLAQAAAEADVAKRFGLLQKAENLINTQVPIVPIYHYVNASLIGVGVDGLSVNPRMLIDWKRVGFKN